MKKTWTLVVISLLGLALFSACASNADTLPSPAPSASVTPSAMPEATPTPSASTMPSATVQPAGVNTVEDARRLSDDVSEEVEKLSELDDAEAVVAGNIALVGISYDAQYQGGLTDRLVEMVKSRVEAMDKTITAVHVTDDEAIMNKIDQLRESLNNGQITFEELQTQVLDIGSSITGGGNAMVSQPQTNPGARQMRKTTDRRAAEGLRGGLWSLWGHSLRGLSCRGAIALGQRSPAGSTLPGKQQGRG